MSGPIRITTPIGRMVQGGPVLRDKLDDDGNKVIEDGQVVQEVFVAIAIAKDNPDWNTFYAALYNVARGAFPHLLDANQVITHPRFSFKIQDGDGVDKNGKSVAGKPGFAGHWIVKMGTRFLPKCYRASNLEPTAVLTKEDAEQVFRRGHFISARVVVQGNGVKPSDSNRVPGIFISPEILFWEGFGPEIVSGEDPREAKKGTEGAYRPAGMSDAPVGGGAAGGSLPAPGGAAPAPSSLPAPGGAAPAPSSLPAPGGAAPAPSSLPAPGGALPAPSSLPSPAPSGPRYQMTAAAQNATREQLLAAGLGWTDESLIAQGLMVIVQ
jgi:hypothetical protein